MLTTLSLLSLTVLPILVLSVPHESLARPFDRREVGPPIDTPQDAGDPVLLNFDNQCTQRSKDDRLLVAQELAIAKGIVQKGVTVQPASLFYQAMFSQDLKNTPGFEIQVHQKYTNLASIYANSDKKVTITCDASRCSSNIAFAVTFAAAKTINICPPWFDDTQKARSNTVVSECVPSNSKAKNWENLAKYKATKCEEPVHLP